MTAAARLIDRLHRVKRTRPGSWAAACPCCESRKGRPLAVTETSDGRTLIHAFCGCSTEDVLGRLGMAVNDLFPAPIAHHAPRSNTRVPSGDVLNALSTEATLIGIIASDVLEKREITEESWERLSTAVARIVNARDYINERIK